MADITPLFSFKCPECEHDKIEEVLTNVVQYSTVDSLFKLESGEVCADYSDCNWDGGEVSRYQCQRCGFVIAETAEELWNWLVEKGFCHESTMGSR